MLSASCPQFDTVIGCTPVTEAPGLLKGRMPKSSVDSLNRMQGAGPSAETRSTTPPSETGVPWPSSDTPRNPPKRSTTNGANAVAKSPRLLPVTIRFAIESVAVSVWGPTVVGVKETVTLHEETAPTQPDASALNWLPSA